MPAPKDPIKYKQYIENLRKSHLGKSHPHKGVKFSKAHKENISNAMKGRKPSKSAFTKEARLKRLNTIRKNGSLSGKNNPAYVDGKTKLVKAVWKLPESKEWRLMIFGRDNYTCRWCKKRGCYLEAHHIKTRIEIFRKHGISTVKKALICKELWDINNGITLCLKCHNTTKKGRGK